jgi:hypothetical protein
MSVTRLKQRPSRPARLAACLLLAAAAAGCAAASRGADPSAPRAGAPYPIALAASQDRLNAAREAWTRLASDQGLANAPAPEFQPVTATVSALPAGLAAPLRLPRIGAEGKEMNDEETREALRRFLASAATPLGLRPGELSLVSYEEVGGGARRAVYQQNPFGYPLRGGFGRVEVVFTRDLRVTGLSSTAVPDVERLRAALAAAPPERVTAEQAARSLAGQSVPYTDAAGQPQTVTVGTEGAAAAREMVILPVPAAGDPSTLELHLAWEVAVGGSPLLLVYVDAVTGVQIGAAVAG